jgi:hypothetical protein
VPKKKSYRVVKGELVEVSEERLLRMEEKRKSMPLYKRYQEEYIQTQLVSELLIRDQKL